LQTADSLFKIFSEYTIIFPKNIFNS